MEKNMATNVKSTNGTARSSLTEEAYRQLKKEILENRMIPGFQAFESELAARLNMSRTPVREAVIRLQEEGLVEVIPRRGIRVLPLSPEDMQEIYVVLTCVESEAAALIARQRPSREELEPLTCATNDMEQALERDDLESWAEADDRYHKELLGLCHNKRLVAIALNYLDQAKRVRMFTLRLRKHPVQSTQDHKDQVEAILLGDADKIRDSYRKHRERAATELLEILEKFKIHNI